VNFVTLDVVDENVVQAAGGSFNTQRISHAAVAHTRTRSRPCSPIEQYHSDGPFEHPNGYDRTNVFAKATLTPGEAMRLSLSGAFYEATWHGSGEIPCAPCARACCRASAPSIPARAAGRSEVNLNADWRWQPGGGERARVQAWASYYRLSLLQRLHLLFSTIPSTAT
jgi:hypothetical protein